MFGSFLRPTVFKILVSRVNSFPLLVLPFKNYFLENWSSPEFQKMDFHGSFDSCFQAKVRLRLQKKCSTPTCSAVDHL